MHILRITQTLSRAPVNTRVALAALTLSFVGACSATPAERPQATRTAGEPGTTTYVVHDTAVAATQEAAGVAAPVQLATVSTRLMGTVTEVLVHEGDRVREGQILARIDSRDLMAKSAQVASSAAEAQAVRDDAMKQVLRMRALHADSAATRVQLEAAETGLARAEAAVRSVRAAGSELEAMTSYSVIRAPFSGVVTKRFVDAGAFAAPGAPLLSVQDASRLRITVSVTPEAARGLHGGAAIGASVDGRVVRAVIEGVVPSGAGNLYTVNALVSNADASVMAGSTATLSVGVGQRTALVVPQAAIITQGDLTGVRLAAASGTETRWVRLGGTFGSMTEVSAGLRAGDRVLVATRATPAATER